VLEAEWIFAPYIDERHLRLNHSNLHIYRSKDMIILDVNVN
jgi:hypothetical protein